MGDKAKVVHCPPGNALNCHWWPQKVSHRYSTYHSQLQVHPYAQLQTDPIDPALWRRPHVDRDREETMHESPSINLTTEPGVATVILGSGMELPEDYRKHPRVQTIDGTDLPPDPADILGLLPSQTRVVLVGGLLSRPVFAAFRTAMHRRRLVYVTRDSRAELKAAIDQVFPKMNDEAVAETKPTIEPKIEPKIDKPKEPVKAKRTISGHGAIAAFVTAHADFSRVTMASNRAIGAVDEARRLLPLARAAGLPTTLDSVANTIGRLKKAGAISVAKPEPKPVQEPTNRITPQSQLYAMGGDQAKVLQLVDDAIAAFQLIREYIQATEKNGAKEQALERQLAEEKAKSEALEKKVRALKEVFGNL